MSSEGYFAAENPDAAERERLQALSHIFDPVTKRRLTAVGIANGWQCLEIGAGAGSMAQWMSERVGAQGRVVATDLDPRFLHACQRPNLEVRRHNILADELERGRYDLVHCRALLMHLPDAQSALARMAAAVKPGGWLAIEEGDMSSYAAAEPVHPRAASFDRISHAITAAVHASRAMDCYFGRRVRELVEQPGWAECGHDGAMFVHRGGERGTRFFQMSSRMIADKLVAAGMLSDADREDHHQAYEDRSFSFVGMSLFGAWAKRAE
jgi:ubiquinone/menaquinone biosynthesis C-methylase UbiE